MNGAILPAKFNNLSEILTQIPRFRAIATCKRNRTKQAHVT